MKYLLALTLLFTTVAFAAEWPASLGTATERTDNTPLGLSEIAGHNMYCGSAVGNYPDPTFYPGATLPNTEIIVTGLAPGKHYCVFTTVDISDRESEYSAYVTFINDGAADPKPPMVTPGQVITVVTTTQPQ